MSTQPANPDDIAPLPAKVQRQLEALAAKGEARAEALKNDAVFRQQVNAYEAVPLGVRHLFARLWGEPLDLSTHRRIAECMQQQYEDFAVVLAVVWVKRKKIDPALHDMIDRYRFTVAPRPKRKAAPAASRDSVQ